MNISARFRIILATAVATVAVTAPHWSYAQASRAALVRDVDRPAAQPVSGFCSQYSTGGAAKCTLYTVPAGKRLVIETVGYLAVSEPSQSVTAIQFGKGDAFVPYVNALFSKDLYVLAPTLVQSDSSARVYVNTVPLKAYLDEGSILVGGVQSSSKANYQQQFAFSGYLVDK